MKALLLLLMFTIAYRIYAYCPNGTFSNAAGDKCYFIPNDSRQFVVAEMSCQDQNGDLASVSNAFDNNDLIANAQTLLGSNVTYVWLGGRKNRKGTWIWSDGQNFTYTRWANGNPDNNIDDNCMVLNLSNGRWYSHNCYDILPYICDFSQNTNQTGSPCQNGYIYYNRTRNCYKIYNNISFNNGEARCQQDGAHLASVHSDLENELITVSAYGGGGQWNGSVWIGLHFQNGNWQWTDGTPIDYTHFGCLNGTYNCYCVLTTHYTDGCGDWYSLWDNLVEDCDAVLPQAICKYTP